jgi:hypothetical protein
MPSSSSVPGRAARALSPIAPAMLVAGVVASSLTGCGDGSTGPGEKLQAPGLHLVAGGNVADTIDRIQAQALVVRVIGQDGRPVARTVVRFTPTEVVTGTGPFPIVRPTMWVSPLTGASWSTLAIDSTDENGQAEALTRMGPTTGAAGVVVSVPVLGFVDTATYTVEPGAPVRIAIAPRDTAVFVGASLSFRGGAVDRHGNTRSDALTYTLSSDRATMSGGTLSASAVGRLRVTARLGNFSDTAGVSIVPRGTITAYTAMQHTGHQLAVFVFDLDGGNFRKLVPSVISGGYFGEMPPVWSSDARTIFYHDNKFDHTRALWVVDVTTGSSRRLATPPNQLAHEAWPNRSRDGQWVYYNGADYGGATLFRIRPDGTGREQVSPASVRQLHPSLSPDGARVAASNGGALEVMDIATKQITPLGVTGFAPAWSPVDDRIAYVAAVSGGGAIHVVGADGSGARAVTSGTSYSGRLDWSSDGKYLVAAAAGGRITVIDVATGEEMPVRITSVDHGFLSPSWKP